MFNFPSWPKRILLIPVLATLVIYGCSCGTHTQVSVPPVVSGDQSDFTASQESRFVVEVVYDLEQVYYDPESLNYPSLYNSALEGVSNELKEHGVKWRYSEISRDVDSYDARVDFQSQFNDAMTAGRRAPGLGEHDLAFAGTDRMLESLHRSHCYFVYPKGHPKRPLGYSDDDSFIGIGVVMEKLDEGIVYFSKVIRRSPAERAGLKPCDVLKAVDGQPLPDDFQKISPMIRGKKGTKVLVSIERQGQKMDFEIERDSVAPPYAEGQLVQDGKYRWSEVELSGFNEISYHRLLNLNHDPGVFGPRADGIILDLRGNPGGSILILEQLLGWFLPAGTKAFITQDENGRHLFATLYAPVTEKPMVILIDGNSGSASEIFSAAMQESGRAVIVGKKSAGAVEVGSLILVDYGAEILITSAQVYTASGKPLEGVGVTPDYEVGRTAKDVLAGRDPCLDRAIEILKAHYEK